MMLRLCAVAAAWLVSSGSVAQDFCAHQDTNALVWDKAFQGSIRKYFSGRKAFIFYQNATIADQVMSGLGGPPDAFTRIDDKTVIASACRAHSCTEKAAVVIDCPSGIAAVAVIHYCSTEREGCYDQPELTLFSDGSNKRAHAALKQWAARVLGEQFDGMPVHVRSPVRTLPR